MLSRRLPSAINFFIVVAARHRARTLNTERNGASQVTASRAMPALTVTHVPNNSFIRKFTSQPSATTFSRPAIVPAESSARLRTLTVSLPSSIVRKNSLYTSVIIIIRKKRKTKIMAALPMRVVRFESFLPHADIRLKQSFT